jgi:hypothetical protein
MSIQNTVVDGGKNTPKMLWHFDCLPLAPERMSSKLDV